jgi:F-type H+-transporting ATPase subunit alpha
MTELLKQAQYSPLSMEEQVLVIYAGTNGFIDDYPVAALGRYESELLAFLRSRKKDLLDEVRTSGKLEGDSEKRLRDALTEFAKQFSVDKSGS